MRLKLIASLLLVLTFSCTEKKTSSLEVPKGGDFSLDSLKGPLSTKEFRGKTLFIFFGFLHCPNICPTTISDLNRMTKLLSEREKRKVAFLFVTLDPTRDTPGILRDHFSNRSDLFTPLWGKPSQLKDALSLFGGGYREIGSGEDRMIDHTSNIFVINRKGEWVNSLPYDASPEELKRAFEKANFQKPYWSDAARAERVQKLGENLDCDLGKEDCYYVTPHGVKYELSLSPRPVLHLKDIELTVRANDEKLTPWVADFIGIETAMGLLRPKLQEVSKNTWKAKVRLPTCDLQSMSWHLRLMLKDKQDENYEIRYGFTSVNP